MRQSKSFPSYLDFMTLLSSMINYNPEDACALSVLTPREGSWHFCILNKTNCADIATPNFKRWKQETANLFHLQYENV